MNEHQKINALKQILDAVLDAIKAAGPQGIPSGHLYAMLMGYGMSLEQYETIIRALETTGQITNRAHLLKAVA